MIIYSTIFDAPNDVTKYAIKALDNHGAPMHFRDIDIAIRAAGWSNTGSSSASTVEKDLLSSAQDPKVFHSLVRLGEGFYTSSNKPISTPTGPPSFDGDPINSFGLRLTDAQADKRQEAILASLEQFLIWAEAEKKLSGKLALARLVNMANQTNHLATLNREHQDISLKELVPHLLRALHQQEWDDRTGYPMHVWASDGTFMMGREAKELSRLMTLKAQDNVTFRATVKATLEYMGATDITAVRKDRSVMFRAVLRGRRVAVSAYQDFASVDQVEVQSLRGALDQYDQEGLIFNLGTVSDEAYAEIEKPERKVIKCYGAGLLLATLARQPATAPTA